MLFRVVMLLALFAFSNLVLMSAVSSAERIALVIGNGNYQRVSALPNPANDAADIEVTLQRLGFEVHKHIDLPYDRMRRVLRDFGNDAIGAKVALIFFASHGIEVDRQNYLIPIDAELKTARDVEYESITLDMVMRAVEPASELRLVLLDACRNNPFVQSMRTTGATRSVGRGLAKIEPAVGTLVSYAAKEGTTADDGEGRNSPYTKALLEHLEEPGIDVQFMFRKVRDSVVKSTNKRQLPFTYGSLPGKKIILKQATQSVAVSRFESDNADWAKVKDTDDVEVLKRFIADHPDNMFIHYAHQRIELLKLQKVHDLTNNTSAKPKRANRIPDTVEPDFFDSAAGKPIVWYRRLADGTIELYDASGFHPETGQRLTPVSPEIVSAWKRQRHQRIAAEQERQRQIEEKQRRIEEAIRKEREDRERVALLKKQQLEAAGQDCDRLAANRLDQRRNQAFPGVDYKILASHANDAISACSNALNVAPDNHRYRFQLARAYQADKQIRRARPLLEHLVNRNYPAAFDNLGWIHLRAKNNSQAVQLFYNGARLGNPEAMFTYALLLKDGKLVKRDLPLSSNLLQAAHNLGHPKAFQELQKLQQQAEMEQLGKQMMQGIFGTILQRRNKR